MYVALQQLLVNHQRRPPVRGSRTRLIDVRELIELYSILSLQQPQNQTTHTHAQTYSRSCCSPTSRPLLVAKRRAHNLRSEVAKLRVSLHLRVRLSNKPLRLSNAGAGAGAGALFKSVTGLLFKFKSFLLPVREHS